MYKKIFIAPLDTNGFDMRAYLFPEYLLPLILV